MEVAEEESEERKSKEREWDQKEIKKARPYAHVHSFRVIRFSCKYLGSPKAAQFGKMKGTLSCDNSTEFTE
jgi:hypothetical protein